MGVLRNLLGASTNQRKGRAGRTRPGHVLRLHALEDFQALRDEPAAQILNEDSTSVVLKALAFGFAATNIPFIDQPPTENLLFAFETLMDL
ncbi:hypothetical protein CONLIGDRAFT_679727 [Coniochaeta ligniaria NRRL 30616]|uniref:RNA helicase n=1 Tax=Coniochaeta ligniaria NRRL 30616 TaxID=1408157 RepID=A0A1J7JT97_9PEZI|nr:hypothetical protein CONLIGDRAFT_679727 [Coniochaeta ligniaria NRRL 30616]